MKKKIVIGCAVFITIAVLWCFIVEKRGNTVDGIGVVYNVNNPFFEILPLASADMDYNGYYYLSDRSIEHWIDKHCIFHWMEIKNLTDEPLSIEISFELPEELDRIALYDQKIKVSIELKPYEIRPLEFRLYVKGVMDLFTSDDRLSIGEKREKAIFQKYKNVLSFEAIAKGSVISGHYTVERLLPELITAEQVIEKIKMGDSEIDIERFIEIRREGDHLTVSNISDFSIAFKSRIIYPFDEVRKYDNLGNEYIIKEGTALFSVDSSTFGDGGYTILDKGRGFGFFHYHLSNTDLAYLQNELYIEAIINGKRAYGRITFDEVSKEVTIDTSID